MIKAIAGINTPQLLLPAVRNYLDITYEDTETDKKLLGIIGRGITHLQDIAGGDLDFDVEAQPRALLLDYCRYGRCNALEVFDANFKSELVALCIASEVKQYANQETTTV